MKVLIVLDYDGAQDPACISDDVDKLKMWADRQFGDPVVWEEVCSGRHEASLNDPEHDLHEQIYYIIDDIDVI